jgi:hypothetical protein
MGRQVLILPGESTRTAGEIAPDCVAGDKSKMGFDGRTGIYLKFKGQTLYQLHGGN